MKNTTPHRIRPAGIHIFTIGRDLIKDSYAALVELVKNAYDADAKEVDITFSSSQNDDSVKITVSDDGHGMDYETVTKKWLVPSTDDKLKRRKSPEGRIMQGRKGIGRYAAAVLGDEMLLETFKDGEKTSILINWDDFTQKEYLDEIEILVDVLKTENQNGTTIDITDYHKLSEWGRDEVELLIKELRKLLSPTVSENFFNINLIFKNFDLEGYTNRTINIEPFPILELYDYKLSGKILTREIGKLKDYPIDKAELIHHKKNKLHDEQVIISDMHYKNINDNSESKRIVKILTSDTSYYCGKISFDFRVYDREPDAIDNLIQRGLKDPDTGDFVSKTDARNILNLTCGIGVYRGDFRIRPHGDPGYDWLELDKKRVQDPSKKIGSNQIVGFITIENEERSHLYEKSARDGLKEGKYFNSFKNMINDCLSLLQINRFEYRKKTGKGRRYAKIENEFQKLFDFGSLEKKIKNQFLKHDVTNEELEQIEIIIEKETDKKSKIIKSIRETVAKYEGQVTLGKIIMVLMHEGRKPLAFFRDHVPRMEKHVSYLEERYDRDYLTLVIDELKRFEKNGDVLIHLFNKLDPLAVKRRSKKKDFLLSKTLKDVFEVFNLELENKWIKYEISCDKAISVYGWHQDYYIALTNLIENSIYWLSDKKSIKNTINAKVIEEDDSILIDYRDNGPGIKKEYIESQIIFEPDFSTKENGTGLGLAIAGEAMNRNNGKIKAVYSEKGVYFRIEIDKKGWQDERSV